MTAKVEDYSVLHATFSDSMTQPHTRIRIRFTKKDELRWISHRDLARVWERLLRRAGILLAFSQGFHPKPKISFPSALALGVEALDEVVELEIVGAVVLTELRARIASEVPPGMELLSMAIADSKARFLGSTFRVELPEDLLEPTQIRIEQILKAEAIEVERDGKPVHCAVHEKFFDLRLDGNALLFSIPSVAQGTAIRPLELLQVLDLGMLLESGVVLQRTKVHLAEDSGIAQSWPLDEEYHPETKQPQADHT